MLNYDEEYYTSNNYRYYLDKSERYHRLANDIYNFLKSIKLMNSETSILDYGCAVGFLLDGLKKQGCNNISGYDISQWAVEQCDKNHEMINLESDSFDFDIIFFLDVLEHMTDEEVTECLSKINASVLIVRIPCALDGEDDFHLEISRMDSTHVNCKDKPSWSSLLSKLGYGFYLKLDLQTIYDADGVFSAIFFKTNA